jgi:hypothetical protein
MNTYTSPEQQGYRDFDLPKEHLNDTRHYVPPKTHDEAEIARRRELSSGTLLAETQKQGLVVARTILGNITDQDGLLFSARLIAAAGINTAWYSYAQNSSVMRRRLKLPIMTHGRSRNAQTTIEDASIALGRQIERADKLIIATDLRQRSRSDHQRRLGVGVGNVSLRLAMYEPVVMGMFPIAEEDEVLMQEQARSRCLEVLEDARTLHSVVGSHPSIAQLSDLYSHLSVYWYRHAPGSAQKAVQEALTT